MSNNFFNLSEPEKIALIKKAADELGMPEIIIEKDIWICWLLEKIFLLPEKMAFKGGTSLSKVFNLIRRFSEDCDITIDYRNFKPDLDLNDTRSQIKKAIKELRGKLKNYISETVLPFLNDEIDKSLTKKLFNITLSEDGEQLRFYYPSIVNTAFLVTDMEDQLITDTGDYLIYSHTQNDNYLRDHVLIEFGATNSIEPYKSYPLKTYLSDAITLDLGLPKPIVNTLDPIRTFFEKATLIHVEYHQKKLKQTPDRLSRHWYDLYMLYNSWVGHQALSQHEILESVVEHKKAFFNSGNANYGDCLSGKFRLIPDKSCLHNLEQDYKQMINAGMFSEEPPSLEKILQDLSVLEVKLNVQYIG